MINRLLTNSIYHNIVTHLIVTPSATISLHSPLSFRIDVMIGRLLLQLWSQGGGNIHENRLLS